MKVDRTQIETLFNDFTGKHVLILGDVMIDSYLWGKVDRISPEAPVPVVSVKRRENLLGGAANVALNIKALSAVPVLCSVIGADIKGDEFNELLHQDGIMTDGIVRSPSRITTTKFRIIGNKAQMLRVDEEMDSDLLPQDEIALLERVSEIFQRFPIGVVILQDYNKGVLTKNVIESVIALSAAKGIPVVVDPKKKNFDAYKKVDLFKPNLKELSEGLKIDLDLNDIASIKSAAIAWQTNQSITAMMVTLSEAGVFIRDTSNGQVSEFHIPAHVRNIADVSGAGDTVISVASLCRAMGVSPFLTASLSNLAGGLVCEFVGVAPVNRERLLSEAIELIAVK
ncbi:MAG: D-glycero-beta-D-manno-heptose-7-phosphate kinase [Lentimicrobiaceae bacterium]|nr:D-glycero-beta-D-manno-heptose-7-phosphate kinase [Lentimicrobiaceae bacterium]MCO5264954.1 bifunctional ADP-heptose synthase [Lentimicrobium sp.]HPG33861.1 PfkB family carbohydrate kinase [Lentimicrobium sp.]